MSINRNLLVLNTVGGGSNITVEKVNEFIRGYEDSSSYKILLPRRFRNIKNKKLISLEMSNAQYAIRDKISKKYNLNDEYISNNNFVHWINKENETNKEINFLINNEKMLSLMNNDINNIPLKWTKNKTTEDILYEHLSEEYLKKINTNLENLQQRFINLLYGFKFKLENPLDSAVVTQTILDKITHNESYLLTFTNNEITYKLFLRDRVSETDTENEVNYFINDFNTKTKLIEFIYNFTNYNSTLNSYNTRLLLNFDETYTYNAVLDDITAPVNIYNYLRNITEYKINNSEEELSLNL